MIRAGPVATSRTFPKDFFHDQKAIWLFPAQWAKGHYLLPTLAIAGGTAGLIEADPHAMPYFRSHAKNLDDINDVFDGTITTGEVIAVPAALLVSGHLRHDDYQVSTSLLAGEAYADSAVVDLVMKAITRRKRPSDVLPGQPFTHTFFSGGQSPFKGSSFPSGHSAGTFGGHSHSQPLSQPPLGAVGVVRFRDRDQLLSHYHAGAFSVRCFSGSRSRLYDYSLPNAGSAVKHCRNRQG